MLHRLGPGRFSTDPRLAASRRLGAGALVIALGAGMTAVVLAFGPEAEPGDRVAVALRWVMIAAIWADLALGALVVVALGRRGVASFPDLEWDADRWRLVKGGETLEGGLRADLHAVQACAAWFELRHDEVRTVTAALEINLAWREGEEVYRANLCRGHGNLAVIARRAQELADALDLPFLFHGRSDDWNAGRRRARARGPVARGGIS